MTLEALHPVAARPALRRSAGRRPAGRRLNRAAVVLWRSRRVVQLELGSRRIVVEDVDPEQLSALLWRPAGSPAAAAVRPLPDGVAELTAVLDDAGFLTSARPARSPASRRCRPA